MPDGFKTAAQFMAALGTKLAIAESDGRVSAGFGTLTDREKELLPVLWSVLSNAGRLQRFYNTDGTPVEGDPGPYVPDGDDVCEVPDVPATNDHQCLACPVEVRDLFAVAANAVSSYNRSSDGKESLSRTDRKMGDLARAVERMRLVVGKHSEEAHRG